LCSQFLQCVALCCSVLQHVAVHRGVSRCVVVMERILQSVCAVCCSVLRRGNIFCAWFLQCVAMSCNDEMSFAVSSCRVLQGVAGCCRVLQCVAVCCSVLQIVAVFCSVLQCVAVCCVAVCCVAVSLVRALLASKRVCALQHSATHYNTL